MKNISEKSNAIVKIETLKLKLAATDKINSLYLHNSLWCVR